jgi:Holliday junction resolvasome RuvABC endonuclease subunit
MAKKQSIKRHRKIEVPYPEMPKVDKYFQKSNIRILALDPATHCGWATSVAVFGVWDLTPKRDESAGMRLIRLRSKLQEVIESEAINLVVFERPGGRNTGAVIVQSEIQGQIKTVCEDKHINYRAYSSKEIKTFATGKGNAGKPAMIAAARAKLGYIRNNDNEADALWLLMLAKSEYK